MAKTSAGMPGVCPEMSTGAPSLMFPTTAADTDTGCNLQTSNLVLQDATVDSVSALILTNDFMYFVMILFVGGS